MSLYLVDVIPNFNNDFIFSIHICSFELASKVTLLESIPKSKHNSSWSISISLCTPTSNLVENTLPKLSNISIKTLLPS